jgi:hypothetical protein
MRLTWGHVKEDILEVVRFLVRDSVIVLLIAAFLVTLRFLLGFLFSDKSPESQFILEVFSWASETSLIVLYFGLVIRSLYRLFRSERSQ